MSQHDGDIANGSGSAVRADINLALAALFTWSSGSSAPSTTFARQRWADTTSGTIKRRNIANSGWIVESTDDETRVLARSSNTILDVSDIGKSIAATGSFTQTLDAAATLGDGWHVDYRNNGSGSIVIDPNSSETIDGASTLTLPPGASCTIWCNGTLFTTNGISFAAATQGEMEAATSLASNVTPGRQHFHPGMAKAWVKWQDNGTVNASYGVSSITDNGTGDHTVNFVGTFSSVQYGIAATATDTGDLTVTMPVSPQTTSCQFRTRNQAGLVDAGGYYAAFYGDF